MSKLSMRVRGFIMIIGGAFLAYVGIYDPIRDAQLGAPVVSIYMKAAGLVPICVIGGVALLVLGEKSTEILGDREIGVTPFGWFFGGSLIVLGFMMYFLVKFVVMGYGYQFQS